MTRDVHLDNAKGVLIVLVVIGHLVWPLPPASPVDEALYTWIYVFHMPMFALISGYLSSADLNKSRLAHLCGTILLPLLVFYAIEAGLLALYHHPWKPFVPQFGLWYLLSLFFWRLLLPLFAGRKGLAVALIIAILSGCVPWIDGTLSMARTLALFPFFLLGYHIKLKNANLRLVKNKILACLCLVSVVLLSYQAAAHLSPIYAVFYHSHPYDTLYHSLANGALVRMAAMTLALLSGLSLLALVPTRSGPLTALGRNSMTIYLLHSPLLLIYREHPALYGWVNGLPVAAMVALGIAVAVTLGSAPVTRAARWLIRPGPLTNGFPRRPEQT